MTNSSSTYAGIKQLSKEFAITMPKARDALKAAKIMDMNRIPVKSEYAQARQQPNGQVWYSWNKEIAFKAFRKAGLRKPTPLEKYSHVENRYQAQSRIDDSFIKIGEISKLEAAYEKEPEKFRSERWFYIGSMHCGCDSLGGAFAVVYLSTIDECVSYLKSLRRVIDEYELACKSICKTKKQIKEVEFYAAAIRRVADWIQLQFFR